MTDDFIMKNCTKCKECYQIAKHMYGCGHHPYKGKWIAEIEYCPKEGEKMAIKEDIKAGYKLCAESIREQIDGMIDELHNAYMNHTDEKEKERLAAQIEILWNVIFMLEDTIVDCDKMFEEVEE